MFLEGTKPLHQGEGISKTHLDASRRNKTVDPLSRPSGFIMSPRADHADLTRLDSPPTRRPLDNTGASDEPPRKRANHGNASPDPRSLFNDEPMSPEVQLPGQRRKLMQLNGSSIGSPSSSAGSPSESRSILTEATSRPRIIRGQRPTEDQKSDDEDPKLKGFKMLYPIENPKRVVAAYHRCKGDMKAAAALLDDPLFQVNSPVRQLTSSPETPSTLGRIRERDAERETQRAEQKERGKQSLIYANRGKLAVLSTSSPTPPPTSVPIVTHSTPPTSPLIVQPARRATKRAVIDSGSEDDEPELSGGTATPGVQTKDESYFEAMALQSFNSHASEALRELTGETRCPCFLARILKRCSRLYLRASRDDHFITTLRIRGGSRATFGSETEESWSSWCQSADVSGCCRYLPGLWICG